MGLDATLIGLTHKVRARVGELLAEDDAAESRLFPLLLRLWLADRDGCLGSLLQASARLWSYDYEEEWGLSSPTEPEPLSATT